MVIGAAARRAPGPHAARCRWVRARRQLRELAGTDVSILAFSGFVSKLDEARVSTVGFDDIIPKPIAPSRLVPLIEAHLPARRRATSGSAAAAGC